MSINVTLNITTLIADCWFAVYRWSVIEKQTPISGNVCVCVWGGGVWLPECTLLTTSRQRTSRYTENMEIYQAENVT